MPCTLDCNNRILLLSKEEKLSKLNQTKKWLNDQCRNEPGRREEVVTKMSVVDNMIVTTVAEAGVLVNQISMGCQDCNRLQEQN